MYQARAIKQAVAPSRLLIAALLCCAALLLTALPSAAASGPYRVKDIKPGTGHSSPADLVAFNGKLLFTAGDGVRGRELWKSDGTAGGTKRVKDIRPGGGGSNSRYLTPCGGQVLFSANDGRGQELWRTDGTNAGTFMVKNIKPGKGNSLPEAATATVFVCLNEVVYFAAGDGVHGRELWRSDGTPAGTYLVADIVAGAQGSDPLMYVAYGGSVYFRIANQLWRSNGTPGGTRPVRNRNHVIVKAPTEATVSGALLFLSINGALWRTNGTAAGTWKIGVVAERMADLGGILYFSGSSQLSRSDGTPTGTFLVKDLPQPAYDLTAVGGTLYLTVDGRLWKSNGTEAGTSIVDSSGPLVWGQLTNVNGVLYSGANHDEPGPSCCTPWQLWRSNGTAAGTEEVGPPSPDFPILLTVVGDTLFFRATDGNGRELWAYVP